MIQNVYELLVDIFAMYALACILFTPLAPQEQRQGYLLTGLVMAVLEWASLMCSTL